LAAKYKCSECKRYVYAHSPDLIVQLPLALQARYDYIVPQGAGQSLAYCGDLLGACEGASLDNLQTLYRSIKGAYMAGYRQSCARYLGLVELIKCRTAHAAVSLAAGGTGAATAGATGAATAGGTGAATAGASGAATAGGTGAATAGATGAATAGGTGAATAGATRPWVAAWVAADVKHLSAAERSELETARHELEELTLGRVELVTKLDGRAAVAVFSAQPIKPPPRGQERKGTCRGGEHRGVLGVPISRYYTGLGELAHSANSSAACCRCCGCSGLLGLALRRSRGAPARRARATPFFFKEEALEALAVMRR
jgi:hypothetical protein